MTRFAALFALVLAACASQPAADNATQPEARASAPANTIPLVIRTAKGAHRFDVEVARTSQQQEQGLMFRKSLGPDTGMLFPMDPPRTASFWMKDTLIPLDMLFIHTDGTIAFLKSNAEPYSRIPVSAGVPVAAVLELAGGRVAALGIGEGDSVAWGGCTVSQEKVDTDLNFCPPPPR